MRLDAPQALKEVHHERSGDYRGGQVDERHRKQPGDHHATEKHAPGEAMPCRPSRRPVKPSQRDTSKYSRPKRYPFRPRKTKKFIPGAST
jgi:hypothetical protein